MYSAQRLLTATLIAIAFQISAMGQPLSYGKISVPEVPREIQAPAGNVVYVKGHAEGTQNYICQASGASFVWNQLGPQATLFIQTHTGAMVQQIATHYSSVNPLEVNTARPTWQSSFDTSAVWGAAVASSTNANFVQPGAIPWLLVQVVGARPGPVGGSMLSETTYIHRINTAAGSRPTTGCSEASHLNKIVYVPYAADYYFYRAEK